MIIPEQQLTLDEIRYHKASLLAKMVQAGVDSANLDADAIVVRDLVVGDSDAASTISVDLDVKTAVASGAVGWDEDAADLTAYQFSSILNANLSTPDRKIVAFFGVYDNTPMGDLRFLKMLSGNAVVMQDECQHLYVYDYPHGYFYTAQAGGAISPSAALYLPKTAIEIDMIFVDASVDKQVGFDAWIAEKANEVITGSLEIL